MPPCLALKIDVDTYRGTREGAVQLAQLLERRGIPATFLFSLGPDHTGRAVRRIFRRGFAAKVLRTSVLSHYGLRTLLYGTLLPGPHIGRRCRQQMRHIAALGFETGVHTYDHVAWQDRAAWATDEWTRQQLQRAVDSYVTVFGRRPEIHGAAGWQVNAHVPRLQQELGFKLASDVRGTGPFLPVSGTGQAGPMQLPTTLPTLDELIGRNDLAGDSPVDNLLQLTSNTVNPGHVFTLHAELEGARYIKDFDRLLSGWQQQGYRLAGLSTFAASLEIDRLPRCSIEQGEVAGRSGRLAVQGIAL